MNLQRQLANLDRAVALERVGGDEGLLREIAVLFLGEAPAMMGEIATAIAGCDGLALERAAHSFKGSVGNFGARKAFQAAMRLEAIGRGRNLDGADAAYAELLVAMDELRPALAALGAE